MSLFFTFHDPVLDKEIAKIEKLESFRSRIANQVSELVMHNNWNTELEIPDGRKTEKITVEYTLDPILQETAEKLFKSYKPDYGAIVMMDAETGGILAMVSHNKRDSEGSHLALRGTFPAASIFKIVTATAAIDKYHMSPQSIVAFNGSNHTLYKKNVLSDRVTRWTREMTLREAFARSVNTFFGRLTLERLQPQDLEDYAFRFGFNQKIATDIHFDNGITEIPKDNDYHLAELASGFNRVTRMSPIQGAMMASAIADDGLMKVPYIVQRAFNEEGELIFQAEPVTAAVTMTPAGADQVRDLMEATITLGTSRKSFKPLIRNKRFKELIVGGKTGSLTGDNPRGKTDWFVGYAMNENQKIAIAALTVNVDYWTVKSSHLAQAMFQRHFKEQFSRENEKFFNASHEREPSSQKKR